MRKRRCFRMGAQMLITNNKLIYRILQVDFNKILVEIKTADR